MAPSMFPARVALNREPYRQSGMPRRSTRRRWRAQLHRGDSTTPFAFRVTRPRSGIDGWLKGAGGSRVLEEFKAKPIESPDCD